MGAPPPYDFAFACLTAARVRAPTKREIREVTLASLADRGTSTACPSEVARRLVPDDWRLLMGAVLSVAASLQKKGLLDAYQRGRPVTIAEAHGPIRLRSADAAAIDYRKHPERYRIGRGEGGVLSVEPYKSELLPLWKFATYDCARNKVKCLRLRAQHTSLFRTR